MSTASTSATPTARRAASSLPRASGYAGEFLVLEETLRDMRSAARRVDRTAPVRLDRRGSSFEVREDSGYPSLRGLPALLRERRPLEPGAVWTAPGTRALDFDDSGAFVLMPFLAQYRCSGPVDYRGEEGAQPLGEVRDQVEGRCPPSRPPVTSSERERDPRPRHPCRRGELWLRSSSATASTRASSSPRGEARGARASASTSSMAPAPLDRGATDEAIVAAIGAAARPRRRRVPDRVRLLPARRRARRAGPGPSPPGSALRRWPSARDGGLRPPAP